jgi:lysozyme family protein
MAATTWGEAIRRLLMHEGGYTNHPSDPGGPTNFGITIHDYRLYINKAGTADDVRAMTVNQARMIYKNKYWNAQRCDELPAGVDYCMFDYGVNSGVGRSGKVLRRLLGLPANTHIVDATVLAAVAKRDPADLVHAINEERLAFLKRLKTWPTFGKGWGRRVAEVDKFATALTKGKGTVTPFPVPDVAGGKGQIPKPKPGPVTIPAGGGAAAAGVGFFDWLAANPGVAVLLVVLVAAAIVGFVHLQKKRRDRKQDAPVSGPHNIVVPERKAA